jgi:hypothetical protein
MVCYLLPSIHCARRTLSSNYYCTTTTHHHHVRLQHTTSLHQVSLHKDLILTPKNLIITHFQSILYYLYNFNLNYNNFCYGMMVTQLTTFVPLYSCINNITLKEAATAAKTCQ